jgi:Skp family chaperone for outer membrane proteins
MFKHSHAGAPILAILFLASLVGCGKLNPGDGVAVLDLDRALKESGLMGQVDNQVDAARRNLQSQVRQLQEKLNAELAQAREAMGEAPSDEQKAAQARRVQAANQQLGQARQRANRILDNRRSQLLAQARRQVRPVARTVSGERGARMVFLAGTPALFDYDTAADITDTVVARLRQQASRLAPAAPQGGNGGGQKPANAGQPAPKGGQ